MPLLGPDPEPHDAPLATFPTQQHVDPGQNPDQDIALALVLGVIVVFFVVFAAIKLRKRYRGRLNMNWQRTMPIVVLVVSLVFLLAAASSYLQATYSESRTTVELGGIGLAGLAFLAWLKR